MRRLQTGAPSAGAAYNNANGGINVGMVVGVGEREDKIKSTSLDKIQINKGGVGDFYF